MIRKKYIMVMTIGFFNFLSHAMQLHSMNKWAPRQHGKRQWVKQDEKREVPQNTVFSPDYTMPYRKVLEHILFVTAAMTLEISYEQAEQLLAIDTFDIQDVYKLPTDSSIEGYRALLKNGDVLSAYYFTDRLRGSHIYCQRGVPDKKGNAVLLPLGSWYWYYLKAKYNAYTLVE